MSFFRHFRQDTLCVLERDPAARGVLEVVLTHTGIHSVYMYRVTHVLWNIGLCTIARMLSNVGRLLTGVEIHPGAKIGERFFVDHGMGIVIGATTEIGNDCSVYQGVTLGGTTWQKVKRHPTLGDGVIVGAGAKILGPILIGDNARVGSNAVVVKEVPAGATAVGIPAKIVTTQTSLFSKVGFEAYGLNPDAPDPEVEAFTAVVDHLKLLDEKLEKINGSLKKANIEEIDLKDLPNYSSDKDLPK